MKWFVSTFAGALTGVILLGPMVSMHAQEAIPPIKPKTGKVEVIDETDPKKADDPKTTPTPIKPPVSTPPPVVVGSGITGKPIVLEDCAIMPLVEVRVPVQVAGILSEMTVKEGQTVKKGQQLALVDDKMASIEVNTKRLEANNKAPIMEAEARLVEATAQRDDSKKLYTKRLISEEEYRVKVAQVSIAEAAKQNAIVQQQVAKDQVLAAEETLKRHVITSPVSGEVVQVVRHQNEAVQALDPIFRIIQTDVVKIEASVPVQQAGNLKPGTMIEVFPNKIEAATLVLQGHTGPVLSTVVLNDNKHCVSAGEDGRIIVWDLIKAGSAEKTAFREHTGAVHSLAINPPDQKEQLLASGGDDGKLILWDVDKYRKKKEIDTGNSPILCISFIPNQANRILTGHEDRKIRLWNLAEGKVIRTFSDHTNYVNSLSVTPDGKRFVSASDDQTCRVWDIANADKPTQIFRGQSSHVHQINLDPTGKELLFCTYSVLQSRKIKDELPTATYQNPDGAFSDVTVFGPKDNLVLAGTDSHQLQLWQHNEEQRYNRLVRGFEGHTDTVRAVSFARSGQFFVSASDDRTVRVWLVPTHDEIQKEVVQGSISFVNPQVELGSQSISLNAEMQNKAALFRPGQFATMVVYPNRTLPTEPAGVAGAKK